MILTRYMYRPQVSEGYFYLISNVFICNVLGESKLHKELTYRVCSYDVFNMNVKNKLFFTVDIFNFPLNYIVI